MYSFNTNITKKINVSFLTHNISVIQTLYALLIFSYYEKKSRAYHPRLIDTSKKTVTITSLKFIRSFFV